MKGTNWLAKLLGGVPEERREDDVENILGRAAPEIPRLTSERSSRILAAALSAAEHSAYPPARKRPLIPAFALAVALLGIVLWSHRSQFTPRPQVIARNPPPQVNSEKTAALRATTAVARRITNKLPGRSSKESSRATFGRRVRKGAASGAHTGRQPEARHPRYTGPASQAQLARILVVTAQQAPIKVSSRTAEPADPGFARVSAYATPDQASGAMLEYTVAGPGSGAIQTSFSLKAASQDRPEALLRVSVDKAGPAETEGSNE
ncbi:MAG TPA: hypothetical protein VGM51_07710 [Armatimonadota bacterium]|jgi:hypothetical protein